MIKTIIIPIAFAALISSCLFSTEEAQSSSKTYSTSGMTTHTIILKEYQMGDYPTVSAEYPNPKEDIGVIAWRYFELKVYKPVTGEFITGPLSMFDLGLGVYFSKDKDTEVTEIDKLSLSEVLKDNGFELKAVTVNYVYNEKR